MEGKKISFGFKKTKKAEKPLAEESKEFIECMEEKSIKVVGGEQVKEAVPLVIPMKPNTLITAERLKQIADEVENAIIEPDTSEKMKNPVHQAPPVNETLDQMVVRELLQGASKEAKMETSELTVPIPSKPVMEGQKESTLHDYEDVPIQEFGMAMLRGMGWTQSKEQSKYKQPQLRPKGLGLGADKVVSENQKKKVLNDRGEELNIVKNSFVKITSGKYNGFYGKVVSLDEENGRAMVDITVKKETVNLSEFMMQAVTKSEFDKESKVINADSFDAYKKNEHKSDKQSKHDSTKSREKEATSSSKSQDSYTTEKALEKSKANHSSKRDCDKLSERMSRDKYRRSSSSSEERSGKRNKDKKRQSSNDSLSSLSDSDKKRKHKSSRRRHSSSDSDSDSSKRDERKKVKKRDIDKKRKGKKKKRDRDRSPHHYKKHRK